jgi:hypothetical protein
MGTLALSRRAGSSGISWRILFLVKKTLHRHRACFEPFLCGYFTLLVMLASSTSGDL